MNLLSLGTADRYLLAIHEPAARNAGRPRAAVICNPWGEEYIYAHRSIRHLAIRLARRGIHTLRFDYFGTGDSGGEESQTDLAGLESDVRSAIEAAQDIAGVLPVALIGLRVGANVAARVATGKPAEIESLVLWDPILAGEEYARTLVEPLRPGEKPAGEPAIHRELRALDLRPCPPQLRERSLVLVTQSEELQANAVSADDPRLAGWPARASVAAPCCWIEAATTTGALPVAIAQRIEEWLQ